MKQNMLLLALITLSACAPKAEPKVFETYSGPKVVAPDRRANSVKDFGPASLVRVGGGKSDELPKGCSQTTFDDGEVYTTCTSSR